MTKSHYPYPPDEFDVRGPEGSPVGVHREPRSGWSSAWPFLLVAVVFAGLAVGVVGFLSDDPGGSENPPAAQQESAAPESSAEGETSEGDGSGEESGDGSGDGSGEESGDGSGEESGDGSGEESGEGEATEEPAEEPAPEPNYDAFIRVLNATTTGGLAGANADVLIAEGYTDVTPDDFPSDQTPPAVDTVWYATAEDEDTALAVANSFGIPAENVTQVAVASGDVLVIVHNMP
ncbi:LytR C-terminal domain-containing protein [Isoptericola sp. 178]|uniref:LytR C-terminal domain-containing protein n=1 Tax=Isoptericola sp. 178 TaxID=3064651 RepID=UPI0027129DCF|nr:LytR C-terminal domain-containing protein [Isoptericola sp. 178]MDO8143905.1 LytR C-terminal domain-containing protein [Isoptericola sp. 178]